MTDGGAKDIGMPSPADVAKAPAKPSIVKPTETSPITSEFTRWKEELRNPPKRSWELVRKLVSPESNDRGYDGRIFDAGSMDDEWRDSAREGTKRFVDLLYGDGFFDQHEKEILVEPRVANWSEDDAVKEARALLRSVVVRDVLMGKRPAVGSAAEAGIIALMGLVLKRKTLAIISDIGELDPSAEGLRENFERARALFIADGKHLETNSPFPGLYQVYEESQLEQLVNDSVEERKRFIDSLQTPSTEALEMPESSITVKRQIVLSGSSKESSEATYRGIPGTISRNEILSHWQELGYRNGEQYWDTKIDKVPDGQTPTNPWGVREWSVEFYRNRELPIKDESLVNIIFINDATSFGALKDVGIGMFRAAIRGSYAVISLPENKGSDGNIIKGDYTRARTLILKQFEAFKEVLPWIDHYVRFVDTAGEMIETVDAIMEANAPA